MSKYLSGHFVGSAGYSQAILSAALGVPPDESTASVWNHIEATHTLVHGQHTKRYVLDTWERDQTHERSINLDQRQPDAQEH